MAIRNFSVGPRRGLAAASADGLPNLLAIAGPNGSGKSALLEQLWYNRVSLLELGSEALYVGPNRTWRAGALNDIATRSFNLDYEQVLKAETLPGFQYVAPGGFNFLSGMSRFGSNADDAQALVKTAIVRIANRAENLIAREYRKQGGRVEQGSVPDLLHPFAELVDTLLPHLNFVRIDAVDSANIKVLFHSKDPSRAEQVFDIDELSSGEKAAIALFLPFIERQVRVLIGESEVGLKDGVVPLTVLLDEPEIHLHPLLQLNVLDYMRRIAASNEAQFIFTTHSPTLLDALEPQELFLLSPASVAPDNQLSRLAESFEKLEVARSITGATHILTRGKPIVFIEGEPDSGGAASDLRITRLLLPETEHWALVPSHGRSQVVRAVVDMRTAHLSLPGLPVFGLVDGDQGQATGDDHVMAWPVAMIENLLLDADSLQAVLAPYAAVSVGKSRDSVEAALLEIANSLIANEIRLRVLQALPTSTLRPKGESQEEIRASIESGIAAYRTRLDALSIEDVMSTARASVEQICSTGQQLQRFHGKDILREFYRLHRISDMGLGWNAFVTEVARHASGSSYVVKLTEPAIQRIRLYFPSEVVKVLQNLPEDDLRDQLLGKSRRERELWESGNPDSESREALRGSLLQFARSLRASNSAAGDELLRHAVAIGTAS